jgi:2-C-methyl-D-erythritol 4-phosphate cytidylyltransferase
MGEERRSSGLVPPSSGSRGLVGAVIAAAGSSTRMGGEDKLFAPLVGRPLLAHVLAAVQECPLVDRIVLVLSSGNLQRGREVAAQHGIDKLSAVCSGGPRRQDSVRLGLEALGPCDWVLVHDGARLLVEPAISEGLAAARETGAAVPAVPIPDTVKTAGPDGIVDSTVDRSRLWAVQTPQVFRYDLLLRAHREVSADVTDDASMLEALGLPVKLFPGSPLNMKVTSPRDLRTAEALLPQAAPSGVDQP